MANSITGTTKVAAATVSYSGAASGSVTCDVNGNYTISGLANGSYTVTPSKNGYVFTPPLSAQTINSADIPNVNFTYSYSSGLDANAWFVPEECTLGTWVANAAPPYIGNVASQLSMANSILTINVTFGSFSFLGGPGEGGPGSAIPLKGASIMWNKMQLTYGTVEVRAKLTGVQTHPAIWLLSSSARGTAIIQQPNAQNFQNNLVFCNEIDIAEGLPLVYSNTTTLRQNLFSPATNLIDTTTVTDYSVNFHTYKVVWTPSSITWFVDGVQTNTTASGIPTGPMMLFIEIDADSSGSGAPSSGNFPQAMQVDYARAWDQNGVLIFSDDFNGSPASQNLSGTNLLFISGAQNSNASASTIAKAFPLSVSTGSILLVMTQFNAVSGTATVTDSLGNAWNQIGTAQIIFGSTNQLWYAIAKAPGGSCTVTATMPVSNPFNVLGIAEYAQPLPGSPVDITSAWTSSGSGTTATTATISTSYSNDTLIVFGVNGDGLASTAGTGFTMRVSGLSNQVVIEDKAVTAIGSYSGTWTQTSANWRTAIIAVKSLGITSSGSSTSQTTLRHHRSGDM
jgi:hypothetical protein